MASHSSCLFQTVVYNLISWRSISNTPDWLAKQIPVDLSENAFRTKISSNTYDVESITQAYCYLVSGVCFSLALKYAGTWNEQTANIIVNFIALFYMRKMICFFFCREIILNNFKSISIVQLIKQKMMLIVMHQIIPRLNSSFQPLFFH